MRALPAAHLVINSQGETIILKKLQQCRALANDLVFLATGRAETCDVDTYTAVPDIIDRAKLQGARAPREDSWELRHCFCKTPGSLIDIDIVTGQIELVPLGLV